MKKRITTENNEKRAVTFGDLKNALKEMDRFDALGAIDSLLLRDHNNSLQFSVSNNNVSEIEEIENATTRMGAVTMRVSQVWIINFRSVFKLPNVCVIKNKAFET